MFPPRPDVPGLLYRPGFVSVEEERALVGALDRQPWRATWQRRTQHYGYSYPEGGDRFARPVPLGPLPEWLRPLADRVDAQHWMARPAENAVVNEYLPGQGISAHYDLPAYGPTVISISLLSPCVMDFVHGKTGEKRSLLLEPGSAVVLGGDARREWKHGIARRLNDAWQGVKIPRSRRISVTFRTVDT